MARLEIATTGVIGMRFFLASLAALGLALAEAQTQGTKGTPYSAEQTIETVQILADGTRITQSSEIGKFYRDSEGRTRTERSFPRPPGAGSNFISTGPVIISDPVAGFTYTLNERRHTATRMAMPTMSQFKRAEASATKAAQSNVDTQPYKFFVKTDPAQGNEPATPGKPHTVRESLGTQTIEGVLAEGIRITTTYPEGSVGNDRPFAVLDESWSSRELGLMVLSKSSDPRRGETITRLINISRSEPDPALFQLPADYTLEDQ